MQKTPYTTIAENTEHTETGEITENPEITGYPEGRIKGSNSSRNKVRIKAGKAHRARQPIRKPRRSRNRPLRSTVTWTNGSYRDIT